MIKRFCDVCGAEIKKFNYNKARITDKDDIPYSNSLWDICQDCGQVIDWTDICKDLAKRENE